MSQVWLRVKALTREHSNSITAAGWAWEPPGSCAWPAAQTYRVRRALLRKLLAQVAAITTSVALDFLNIGHCTGLGTFVLRPSMAIP